ncbi:hypothetical protein IMZ48_39740, partial [Candidatus Bathyarchaeota archaeon]|nr:hypothetical protein [Candidatus Bathyarchaeota archaeon]
MFLNTTDSGPAILQRGPIAPGSYIQFLTCPNPAPARAAAAPGSSVVLGTSATRGGEVGAQAADVGCFWGHFGALSRGHFFLEGEGRELRAHDRGPCAEQRGRG